MTLKKVNVEETQQKITERIKELLDEKGVFFAHRFHTNIRLLRALKELNVGKDKNITYNDVDSTIYDDETELTNCSQIAIDFKNLIVAEELKFKDEYKEMTPPFISADQPTHKDMQVDPTKQQQANVYEGVKKIRMIPLTIASAKELNDLLDRGWMILHSKVYEDRTIFIVGDTTKTHCPDHTTLGQKKEV